MIAALGPAPHSFNKSAAASAGKRTMACAAMKGIIARTVGANIRTGTCANKSALASGGRCSNTRAASTGWAAMNACERSCALFICLNQHDGLLVENPRRQRDAAAPCVQHDRHRREVEDAAIEAGNLDSLSDLERAAQLVATNQIGHIVACSNAQRQCYAA